MGVRWAESKAISMNSNFWLALWHSAPHLVRCGLSHRPAIARFLNNYKRKSKLPLIFHQTTTSILIFSKPLRYQFVHTTLSQRPLTTTFLLTEHVILQIMQQHQYWWKHSQCKLQASRRFLWAILVGPEQLRWQQKRNYYVGIVWLLLHGSGSQTRVVWWTPTIARPTTQQPWILGPRCGSRAWPAHREQEWKARIPVKGMEFTAEYSICERYDAIACNKHLLTWRKSAVSIEHFTVILDKTWVMISGLSELPLQI